ncbi:S8 family peptidase [Dokdonella ginsengisoli]|uniref:S8 family serine peptidase n=1 Tax=Dokdonella ginsengisoli TaxID=363846 RepID=A0ABV9QX58_9GAMM
MNRLLLPLLLLFPFATTAPALAAGRIGDDVDARLRSAPRATVVVVLKTDAQEGTATQREERKHRIAASVDGVLAALPAGSYALRRRFDHVAAVSLDVSAKAVDALRAQADVVRVDLDVGGGAQMPQAAPLARVSEVRARGLVGQGVKTVVVDSGARLDHPDLAGSIVGQQCFCSSATPGVGCCPNGSDTQSGAGSAADGNGHGTNVTGIVTGDGTQSPQGGAPAAATVVVRMLDDQGRFNTSADIVAALDWIASQHPDAKVVNLSLGTDQLFDTACDDSTAWTMALAQAAAAVAANGTLMTVSSGNQASPTSLAAPACLSHVLAIGAVWDSAMPDQTFLGCTDTGIVADKPTCFTNSNAGIALYAPGAYTTSTGLGAATSTYGGTSQAAPLVAACIADLFQFKPNLTRDRVTAALRASPTHVTDPKNGLSFPRLDCESALIDVDRVFADGFD